MQPPWAANPATRVSCCLLQVGNFRVEPPGLFRGRGEHPKMGMLKRRIFPEDITLNLAEGAPIPPCPVAGRSVLGLPQGTTARRAAAVPRCPHAPASTR